MAKAKSINPKKPLSYRFKQSMRDHWQLFVLLALPVAYLIIFNYIPMYGAQIAFRNFKINDGIWGSEWVGLEQFKTFFNTPMFAMLIKNTLSISVYALIVGAPFPIILALMLKYLPFKRISKSVQLITYVPHFISVVVMVSIINEVLYPNGGMIDTFLSVFGLSLEKNYLASTSAFADIYVWSGIWQNMGFSAVIYISILSGVDPSLHEAAMIDGASMWKRAWYIDLPAIIPQFTISLILSLGSILNVGFEKVLLLQNDLNLTASEIISTYVYNMGIAATMPNYSYTTAIGLFQSVIALILIVTVNKVVNKMGGTSLW